MWYRPGREFRQCKYSPCCILTLLIDRSLSMPAAVWTRSWPLGKRVKMSCSRYVLRRRHGVQMETDCAVRYT